MHIYAYMCIYVYFHSPTLSRATQPLLLQQSCSTSSSASASAPSSFLLLLLLKPLRTGVKDTRTPFC